VKVKNQERRGTCGKPTSGKAQGEQCDKKAEGNIMAKDMVELDPQFQWLTGAVRKQVPQHSSAINIRHNTRNSDQDTISSVKRKEAATGPA